MLTWILSNWNWKSFAIGAGAALFGGTIARPVLVGAVKTGLDVKDRAAETLAQAKAQAQAIHNDAVAMQQMQSQSPSELVTELQKLREEIASLKGAFGYTSKS